MTPTSNTKIIAARVPDILVQQIDARRRQMNWTRSRFITRALDYFLRFGPKRGR